MDASQTSGIAAIRAVTDDRTRHCATISPPAPIPQTACFHRPRGGERLKSAGYVVEGERVGHARLCWPNANDRKVIVHVVVASGHEWQRRVTFRDALRSDSRLAAEYESVKEHAADQAHDWDEYTSLKAAFVQEVLGSRL